MTGPDALLAPAAMAGLWLLLHGADWFLTVAGARARAGVAERFPLSTGYELNPLFQRDIARGGWISPRFLVTWIGGALLFYAAYSAFGALDVVPLHDAPAMLAGMLVFTRVAVVGRHIQNLWLFRRVARVPGAMRGAVSYDAPTTYRVSAIGFLQFAVVLAVAAYVSRSAWLVGGAAGCALIAAKHLVLGARAKTRAVEAAPR